MAASQLLIVPFQVYVGLTFIRRHVFCSWLEMVTALRESVVVTCCSAVPALLVIALANFEFNLSFGLAPIAGGLSVCGWTVGLG